MDGGVLTTVVAGVSLQFLGCPCRQGSSYPRRRETLVRHLMHAVARANTGAALTPALRVGHATTP